MVIFLEDIVWTKAKPEQYPMQLENRAVTGTRGYSGYSIAPQISPRDTVGMVILSERDTRGTRQMPERASCGIKQANGLCCVCCTLLVI